MAINRNSAATVPLRLYRDDTLLSHATGCVYKHQQRLFIVTNWHVLSGRDAHSGMPLDKSAAIPNSVQIPHILPLDTGKPISTLAHEWFLKLPKWVWRKFPLFDDFGTALWYQHPHGRKVDLAALPVERGQDTGGGLLMEIDSVSRPIGMANGSDCFVIGFPLEPDLDKPLPIWKRATVASEYQLPYNDLPCFLVDTATRKGMSGSPVIISPPDGAIGGSTAFLGIYSGRLGANNIGEVQLGVVWRKSAVEEMLEARRIGPTEAGE